MATVEFKRLTKRFGSIEVVHAIDLSIADGEFVVLVGPSGCGKSTTLRMLAGLEDISNGHVLIDGRVVNEIESRDRDIAMVFQDYALYPHMTVHGNMAFSLRYRSVARREIDRRVREAAETLALTPYLDRYPRELSGGQRQRVAMGRAIVRKPRVFLFDEPLSNLDAKLRGNMRLEMKRLHQELAVTTVYVTHDQTEAMTLADRIVVMNAGRIEQIGAPEDVYHAPASLFVAGFIGAPTMNMIPVNREGDGGLRLANAGLLSAPQLASAPSNLVLGVRPEDIDMGSERTDARRVVLAATIEVVEPLGADTLVFAGAAGHQIAVRVRPEMRPQRGMPVHLSFDLDRAHWFDATTGKRLGPNGH
jgi:multiple sugar transport system ATP-binding protein